MNPESAPSIRQGKLVTESRISRLGAICLIPTLPLLPIPFFIWRIVEDTNDGGGTPGWVKVGYGLQAIVLQLVVAAIVLGSYWNPRLRHLVREDGKRIKSMPVGFLFVISVLPLCVAAKVWLDSGVAPTWMKLICLLAPALIIGSVLDRLTIGRNPEPER